MLFDKYLSRKQKIIIAIISGCVWIYLNYRDPLFLPIGLLGLYLVSYLFR